MKVVLTRAEFKNEKGGAMSRMAVHGLLGLLVILGVAGCMPLGVTALGVGGSTAVSHTLNGITYRTFTASSSKVKKATITALNRMDIRLTSTRKENRLEILSAAAESRTIEVQLETLSPNTTRMRVTAKNGGLIYDSATATEIILQTERVMESNA
jgi:hypothetical protein